KIEIEPPFAQVFGVANDFAVADRRRKTDRDIFELPISTIRLKTLDKVLRSHPRSGIKRAALVPLHYQLDVGAADIDHQSFLHRTPTPPRTRYSPRPIAPPSL